MVHGRIHLGSSEVCIGDSGHHFSNPLDLCSSRGTAVELAGFVCKPIRGKAPGRGEDVRMPVEAVLCIRGVDADLGSKAVALNQRPGDLCRQVRALLIGELVGQRHFELPRHRRVFATFRAFRRGPKLGRGQRPLGGVVWHHAARFHDSTSAPVVVTSARDLVEEEKTSPIGCGCEGRMALSSAKSFDACVVDRHGRARGCALSFMPWLLICASAKRLGFKGRQPFAHAFRRNA